MPPRSTALLIAALTAAAGCGRAVPRADNPAPIPAERYHRVFDAAVETLRDLRFTVDRKDRRFGVITTEPLIASSVFEPWHADNSTARQIVASTLNLRRRSVRIRLEPHEPEAPAAPAYRLHIHIAVEQREHAALPLVTPAVEPNTVQGRDRDRRRPALTETGRAEPFWRPVGRDRPLERRLIHDILSRAAEPS